MIVFPLLIAAIATLGLAGDLRAEGDVHAGAVARSADMADGSDVARAESAIALRLALLTEGRLRLQLSYAPSLVVPSDLSAGAGVPAGSLSERTVVTHRVAVGAETDLSAWRLHTTGRIDVGETLFATDQTTRSVAEQPVRTTARIPHYSADAAAGAATSVRGTTLALTAGAAQSGGYGGDARDLLPLLQELRLGASARRRLSSRHEVGLNLTGNRSRVDQRAAGDVGYLGATGSWSHALSRRTDLQVSAGAVLTWERESPPGSDDLSGMPPVLPLLEGSLGFLQAGLRPSFRLGLAAMPVVDRYRGAIDVSTSATGVVMWAPLRHWSFGARGSTAAISGSVEASPASSGPHTFVHAAGLDAGYRLSSEVQLTASAGSTWQVTDRTDLTAFREDVVNIGLAARLFAL